MVQIDMGSNVFGTPVTEEMLKAMPEYHAKEKITQKDKAIVAFEMKNAEGKDINAKRFVENLKNSFGNKVCTMCLIYNATGEMMTFVQAHDWKGFLCESPYPVIIENGQWGAFLHGEHYGALNDDEAYASVAGFVYSAINNVGKEKHWFMGFHNEKRISSNKVYTEIKDVGNFQLDSGEWRKLDDVLNKYRLVHHKTNENGGLLFSSIGNIASCVFEAILTLPEVVRC